MNIKSIEYDLFFSFEYHQNAFVEIHFVTFRKNALRKKPEKCATEYSSNVRHVLFCAFVILASRE